MSQADQLLHGILDNPEDQTLRLVFADWLEEQPGELCRVRAALLRLQVEREQRAEDERGEPDRRARQIFTDHPDLVGPLGPLLKQERPLLREKSALAMFLAAPLAGVQEGPLAAGSTWEGHLLQGAYRFPTTLWLRKRAGNACAGDMQEDFTSMYGRRRGGRFSFRGVIVGRRHLAFVTYKVTGAGSGPALYELRLGRAGWLSGTWRLTPFWGGEMRLRRARAGGLSGKDLRR
jgi:uncharacterized protein (TIGR02996 family)